MDNDFVRVKLKDIKKNPFRNFDIYPIREDKVFRLMESIRATTFWGGLVGRKKDGKVEIAYGHHRLDALKKMFDEDPEIDIVIRDFSDPDMMKLMSRENAEEWACPIAAIDDAVKAVRDYLMANRDSLRQLLSSTPNEDKRLRIGARVIAKFMGKKEGTVRLSLERLNPIERGELDREALYLMPSSAAAYRFAKAVKDCNLKKENQKLVAEKIAADQRFGERSIYETVLEFFPREQIKKINDNRASYYDVQLKKAIWQITKLRKTLATLAAPRQQVMFGGIATTEDITPETLVSYNRAIDALRDCIVRVGESLDSKAWANN